MRRFLTGLMAGMVVSAAAHAAEGTPTLKPARTDIADVTEQRPDAAKGTKGRTDR